MIFVAGADEEDVFHWDVPAGLFNDKGEMVWEPERWEPENAYVDRVGQPERERGHRSP